MQNQAQAHNWKKNSDLRKAIVDLVIKGKGGHIPSAFSIVDIIDTAYGGLLRYDPKNPDWDGRDYFILSKGHGCAALYVVLKKYGFVTQSDMDKYLSFEGILGGHPDKTKVPGVEASTGSLGHGLPFSTGIALGLKIKDMTNRVIVLVGDGECHEGTIWEAALVSQNYKLNNLCCIVDLNGSAEQVLPHPDISEQWSAFGWRVRVIDGHDVNQISAALSEFYSYKGEQPTAIIANTVKGKGVGMMETHGPWHYKVPNREEYEAILAELQR